MENQPTQPSAAGRLLFRLASMARQQQLGQAPAPAPAPAPAASTTAAASQPALVAGPRIPLPRPPTEQSPGQPQPPQSPLQSQQTPPTIAASGEPATRAQPESTQQAAPSPAVPSPPAISQTSPAPPPSPRSRLPSREPTPPQSPKVIKQSSPIPPESPKVRQLQQPIKTPPESPRIRELQPIKAPPPYPEPEPKPPSSPSPRSKFTQQGNGNESAKTISDINEKPVVNGDQSPVETRFPLPSPKKKTAPDETGMATARKKDENGEMKIVTMAGENTGAYMELGRSYRQNVNRKQQPGHQLQYGQTKGSGESESKDGKSDDKKKDKGKKSAGEGKPIAALVNSNVQSINNSILFRSSSIQQSPGVRLTIVSQRPPKHEGTTHQ